MAKEIERKFLVKDDSYVSAAVSHHRIAQGYLSDRPEATVRVRISGDKAWLTVKGLNDGATRDEFEYAIPLDDAKAMLRLCSTSIEKTRYLVPFGDRMWEVDAFDGRLAPLIIAEVELPDARADVILPPFVGEEVTGDPRYYNSVLAQVCRK